MDDEGGMNAHCGGYGAALWHHRCDGYIIFCILFLLKENKKKEEERGKGRGHSGYGGDDHQDIQQMILHQTNKRFMRWIIKTRSNK